MPRCNKCGKEARLALGDDGRRLCMHCIEIAKLKKAVEALQVKVALREHRAQTGARSSG